MNFLWTTFTRFEPAADIHSAATRVVRHHVVKEPPILIDARLKPSFPKELVCDAETAAAVTRRWREYFPSGVEMGRLGRSPPRPRLGGGNGLPPIPRMSRALRW
jgi:hypothetical protein